mgnify:CR=1 FL=1
MSWITENAMKRVFGVYKRSKERKVPIWENDVDALKLLNEELKNATKRYVSDNVLFLKLVCICLKERSGHYSDIKMAVRSLDSDLKTPLPDAIEMLRISLNHTDRINYLKEIGIDFDSHANQDDILKANQKDFLKKLMTNWSFEKVENSLYNSTNDFLKDLNNYQ